MNMTTKNDIFTRYLKEYLKASNERENGDKENGDKSVIPQISVV